MIFHVTYVYICNVVGFCGIAESTSFWAAGRACNRVVSPAQRRPSKSAPLSTLSTLAYEHIARMVHSSQTVWFNRLQPRTCCSTSPRCRCLSERCGRDEPWLEEAMQGPSRFSQEFALPLPRKSMSNWLKHALHDPCIPSYTSLFWLKLRCLCVCVSIGVCVYVYHILYCRYPRIAQPRLLYTASEQESISELQPPCAPPFPSGVQWIEILCNLNDCHLPLKYRAARKLSSMRLDTDTSSCCILQVVLQGRQVSHRCQRRTSL